jgi:hypothetical protein
LDNILIKNLKFGYNPSAGSVPSASWVSNTSSDVCT